MNAYCLQVRKYLVKIQMMSNSLGNENSYINIDLCS